MPKLEVGFASTPMEKILFSLQGHYQLAIANGTNTQTVEPKI